MTTEIAEYTATEAGLATLRQQFAGRVFDVATTKGMDEAKAARRELVSLRTTLESKRQELKAPILERGRTLDAEAKRITAAIAEMEEPIDQQIKRRELELEAARKAKQEAEEARIRAEQEQLDLIVRAPLLLIGKPAAKIAQVVVAMRERDMTVFSEAALPRAKELQAEAITQLEAMHKAASEAEAQAAENERLHAQEREAEAQRQRDAEAAEASRRAAEKAAALESEHIADIMRLPLPLIGAESVRIWVAIEDAQALQPSAVIKDPDRLALAEKTKADVVAKLQQMYEQAVTVETERKARHERELAESLARQQAEEATQRAQNAERMAELRKSTPPLLNAASDALTLLVRLAPNDDATLKLRFAIEAEAERMFNPKRKRAAK
jgi:hypothetical protein